KRVSGPAVEPDQPGAPVIPPAGSPRAIGSESADSSTSSVQTTNRLSLVSPNDVVRATSTASRPSAIVTRPILGSLCLASKVYQRPPRYASNQPLKSIG